jgi:hypothetical protein
MVIGPGARYMSAYSHHVLMDLEGAACEQTHSIGRRAATRPRFRMGEDPACLPLYEEITITTRAIIESTEMANGILKIACSNPIIRLRHGWAKWKRILQESPGFPNAVTRGTCWPIDPAGILSPGTLRHLHVSALRSSFASQSQRPLDDLDSWQPPVGLNQCRARRPVDLRSDLHMSCL